MSRILYLSPYLVLLSFVASPISASADCRAKSIHQNNNEIQIVVPYAVPVGVPVAPFAPYFYSYRLDQSSSVANQPVAEQSRFGTVDNQTHHKTDLPPAPEPAIQAAKSSSLVATHCATCHGGEHPKAGLSLEQLESLSAANRLKAIDAVVTERMPKAHRLSSAEIQATIKELASHDSESELPSRP